MSESLRNPPKMQFESVEQQAEANALGMWVFLATEVLFLGGLFLVYAVYRWYFNDTFVSASEHLNLPVAILNTVLLLTSSLTMAVAEHCSESQRRSAYIQPLLTATLVLGVVFLLLKGYEYAEEYSSQLIPFVEQPFLWEGVNPAAAKLFFNLYFVMTGLHAIHLLIGCGLVMALLFGHRRRVSLEYHQQTRMTALYWHFVDIVWVFLLPMLYLVR